MQTVGLPGVSYGGVSRGDGWTAPGRSEYQMGVERRDGVPADKQRGGDPVKHMRQWLMLPQGVDPALWNREAIWYAAQQAEARNDAREGRFFDLSWPTELPTDCVDGFVTEMYGPLAAMGLAVQVDWETSAAADSQPNDHLHGLISTRILSNDGFSPRKCRELDVWFRANVRLRVARLFNAIAEERRIDVRFDARPNAEQEDALPPEDHLPRGMVRNRQSAGSARMLERREAQRQLKREHDAAKIRIEALRAERQNLLAEVEIELDGMAVLTSWQHGKGSVEALSVETAMTALMGKGVVIDLYLSLEGLGMAYVIGRSAVIDQGDRILLEEPFDDDAIRTMQVLARSKGWRDVSLSDASGMPMPVPADPARTPVRRMISSDIKGAWQDFGKYSVVHAAKTVVERFKSATPPERKAMVERVLAWGSPQLGRLVSQLVAHADASVSASFGAETLAPMMDQAMHGKGDLWQIYVLEQDLVAMTVPGNVLSGPFRPHPRFYDYYNLSGDAAGLENADGFEGAAQ